MKILIALLVCVGTLSLQAANQRPNVVFILNDDQGATAMSLKPSRGIGAKECRDSVVECGSPRRYRACENTTLLHHSSA